jgi:hypothetical protein
MVDGSAIRKKENPGSTGVSLRERWEETTPSQRPETPVPEWRKRLVCSSGGSHDTDIVVIRERR